MKSDSEVSDDSQEILCGGDTICNVCYAEFLDSEDLEIHIKQMHTPANPKYCQFCTETYTDKLDYAAHVRDTHLMDMRSCSLCTKVFLNGAKLNFHERKHYARGDNFSCSQCDSVFREMIHLELHERKNHDNTIDGCFLKCMPCLSSILNLKAVQLLQTVGRKTFICPGCNFSSENLEAYKQHLKKKKCSGYVCDRCASFFVTRNYLIKHLKHTKKCLITDDFSGKTTKTCKDCNREVHVRLMQYHVKNCNALKCIDCNKVYRTIEELSVHQIKEHPLDMTVIRCQFCLKEFIGKGPLKKHITRVHKPFFHLYKYKCVSCNDIFQHPRKLFAHYFTKHKKLEPFNCKICNKKFRVRKGFSLHIKIKHQSVGYVEFDDRYHVFFTDKKSERPFIPDCVVPQELLEWEDNENMSKAFSLRSPELLEIDDDATDVDSEDDKPVERKPTPKEIKIKQLKKTLKKKPILIYSSDDEPLLEMRKRTLKRKGQIRRLWNWKKNSITKSPFTCDICSKNCYTYQNHQNHLSLHNKNQVIECVKCLRKFNSINNLTKHIRSEHASSKLTDTLKNLLKKKKHDVPTQPTKTSTMYQSPKEVTRFKINMKKVIVNKSRISATITPVHMSVKNFIENFTPDVTDTKETVEIASDVSITPHVSIYRKPTIKLTKFKDEPMYEPGPLKMPERFKQHDHFVKTKITIKLNQRPLQNNVFVLPDYDEHNYFNSFQDDRNEEIPEVAHEVSLEGTEEPPRVHLSYPTRIVIPKMPKGYSKIHIATLQPNAPYFKIIKVDSEKLDELQTQDKDKEKEEEPAEVFVAPRSGVIDLPGGKKLVSANPLAHLMGDTQLDQIIEPGRYKPAIKDFQGMLAQAMQKLEEPPRSRKRKLKSDNQDKNSNNENTE